MAVDTADVSNEEVPLSKRRQEALERQQGGLRGAPIVPQPPSAKKTATDAAPAAAGPAPRTSSLADSFTARPGAVTRASSTVAEDMRMSRMQSSAQLQARSRSTVMNNSKEEKKTGQEEVANRAASLEHWLDAGLRLGSGVARARRAPPEGYEVAPLAREVPFLQHQGTGVILWPIRLDLMPFFTLLEGTLPDRPLVTVYHYTSEMGFAKIIARFEDESGALPSPQGFAEELWDRLVEDEDGQEAYHDLEVPSESFAALSDPPDCFPEREKLCRAVGRLPAGASVGNFFDQVSYCVPLRVPADRLLSTRAWPSSVFVAAPGTAEDAQSSESDDEKLHFRSVKEAQRVAEQERLLAEIQHTGEVAFLEGGAKQKKGAGSEEYQQKLRAEEAVAQLEEQWHRCERKLKKAYEEIMAGSGEDPHRIHKLEKQLEKIEQELQDAKQHLLSFDDELGLMHQRQVKSKYQYTELGSIDSPETVYELGDEYVELKGDLLHDVLGGYVTPEMEKLLAEVKAMRLLDGLVNRKTGEVEFIEDDPKQIEMIKTVASVSQEHDQLKLSAEEEVSRLEQQQQRCERKLKKAKEEMELARKGQGSSFFSYDPKRIQKLEQHVRKTTRELQDARQHLLSFDDEVARAQRRQAALDSLSSNAEGAKSAAQSTAPVVRKPVTTQYSEFAGDLLDTVYEVGDEYVELKGDLLRDMLGGSLAGARTYLESRGDPNVYDSSTGWTPLLMAVSSGHTQLVDLLLQCKADPAKGAKSTGETAVHLAVYRTSGEVLQQLLNFRRQCVQDVRQDGSTALMLALERSPPKVKIEYVRSLLEKNADPNVKRKDGWSALGLAIRANMRPATKMMIAVEGKVLSTVPGSQLTLWELAEQHKDLQKLIKSKLSSKNLAEIEKRWPGTLLRMQIAD